MTRRFSAQELTYLRNNIPIACVIEAMLSVATGNNNGSPTFSCPACHGANTSINAKHNLARCFDCRQNFNPIEFVMHQRHASFVDSVKWLKRHHRQPLPEKASSSQNPSALPINIGDVLSGVLPSLIKKPTADLPIKALTKRVLDLEDRVEKLDLLVKELRFLGNQR
jgi:DNA primase